MPEKKGIDGLPLFQPQNIDKAANEEYILSERRTNETANNATDARQEDYPLPQHCFFAQVFICPKIGKTNYVHLLSQQYRNEFVDETRLQKSPIIEEGD